MQTPTDASNLHAAKSAMRKLVTAKRKAAQETHPDAAALLANRVTEFLKGYDAAGSAAVSGFLSIGSEIDTAPTLQKLSGTFTIALPVVVMPDAPLIFRQWQPGDQLEDGAMGIAVPLPSQPIIEPEVLLVPLLAFDAKGFRLGYGGGYYDRTLANLNASRKRLAIGLAFDEQEVASVPIEVTDIPLDAIITPTRAMTVGRST